MCRKMNLSLLVMVLFQAALCRTLTGQKKIKVEMKCSSVSWSEHTLRQCSLNITISGFPEFPFTKDNFLSQKTDFFVKESFADTCFDLDTVERAVDKTEFSEESKVLSHTIKTILADGNMACVRLDLAMKNAFQTKEKCVFLPKTGPAHCQSKEDTKTDTWTLTYNYDDVTKQSKLLTNGAEFQSSKSASTDCELITDSSQYLKVRMDDANCEKFPAPVRCTDPNWNGNQWEYCSTNNLGISNLDLFPSESSILATNLDGYCSTKVPNFKACLNPDVFCDAPDMKSFYLYRDFYSHYTGLCAAKDSYKTELTCVEIIEPSKRDQARDHFDKCFTQAVSAGKDACSIKQLGVVCRPLILHSYAKGCSSFDELYQIEIDTRDWSDCPDSKSKIDPCKTTLDARIPKCNGAPAAIITSTNLFLIASSLFLYQFIFN